MAKCLRGASDWHCTPRVSGPGAGLWRSGSINRVLAVLRRAVNLAAKWDVCGGVKNPASGLSVGPDILRSRFLSIEEAHRLIADRGVASAADRGGIPGGRGTDLFGARQ
jgi:hypothetical protein